MKRILILCLCFCLCLVSGCTDTNPSLSDNGRIKVVTTLFPQYDFAREIAGDYADITLLLPPGSESHSYEPSPTDMMAINNADLFIYTGNAMEGWASGILESLDGDPVILDLSEFIDVHETGHETAPDEARHDHDVDPHIFTNPRYAIQMASAISGAISKIDPEHADVYEMKGAQLHQSLSALDQSFRTVVENGKRNKLIFGGRFAFAYFVEEYGLSYEGAYDSCSSEAEPAAGDVARLIDTVKAEKIPVVFYEELSDPKVARLICEETGAKPLLFHSCHNISKDEFESGASYLSLMRTNVEHLKEALN